MAFFECFSESGIKTEVMLAEPDFSGIARKPHLVFRITVGDIGLLDETVSRIVLGKYPELDVNPVIVAGKQGVFQCSAVISGIKIQAPSFPVV